MRVRESDERAHRDWYKENGHPIPHPSQTEETNDDALADGT